MPDIYPIPAVLADGKPWTFQQGKQGSTDHSARRMTVPTGPDSYSRGARTHEMLHVALSPPGWNDTADEATIAAEEGRVESAASLAGLRRRTPATAADVRTAMRGAAHRRDGMALPALAVSAVGSPWERPAREWLARNGKDDVLSLMDRAASAYRADPSYASTARVADMLRALGSGKPPGPVAPPPPGPAGGPAGMGVLPRSVPPQLAGLGPVPERLMPRHETFSPPPAPSSAPIRPPAPGVLQGDHAGKVMPVDMAGFKMSPGRSRGDDDIWADAWSHMTIDIPRRPVAVARIRGRKRTKATDYGTVPTRMWRATLDGKVFSSKKHTRQGTVLIDQSGSMSISADDVRQLIDDAPAAIVAVYSGDFNLEGQLRIVAAAGRMVEPRNMYPYGSGNQVDGPALHWLAHQRGPRIWVCDDGLTGNYDRSATPAMETQAHRIAAAYRIRRIDPYPDSGVSWIDAVRQCLR